MSRPVLHGQDFFSCGKLMLAPSWVVSYIFPVVTRPVELALAYDAGKYLNVGQKNSKQAASHAENFAPLSVIVIYTASSDTWPNLDEVQANVDPTILVTASIQHCTERAICTCSKYKLPLSHHCK